MKSELDLEFASEWYRPGGHPR